jgi:hypothetical protein
MVDGRLRHRSGEMNEARASDNERSVTATLGYRL